MNVWVLKVIAENAPEWQASTYKGEVLVRAYDEEAARREASNHYFIAAGRKLGEEVKASPWLHAQLVSCEQYFGSEHQAQGEAGVLYPSNT